MAEGTLTPSPWAGRKIQTGRVRVRKNTKYQ